MIETRGVRIVIDAGPDFRQQMLRHKVDRLDAILLTHEHKDHIGGMDDVRAFNYTSGRPVDVYATEQVQQTVRKDYDYAFGDHRYPGVPDINLVTIDPGESFFVKAAGGGAGVPVVRNDLRAAAPRPLRPSPVRSGQPAETGAAGASDGDGAVEVEVTPIRGMHYMLPVLGFRIGGVAYLTDFNSIEDSEIEKLRGVGVLVINALRRENHISHFSLDQALHVAWQVGAGRTLLTHVSHQMGRYAQINGDLPPGVSFACDGQEIEVGGNSVTFF